MRRVFQGLRLETDRTLRSRAFVARAVKGELTSAEYGDLLGQFSALATASGSDELARVCSQDLAECPEPNDLLLCESANYFAAALGKQKAGRDALLAAAGTSWSGDAADSLSSRQGFPTSLLGLMSQEGWRAVDRLRKAPAHVSIPMFEAARGAVLGAVGCLDHKYQAPMAFVTLGAKG